MIQLSRLRLRCLKVVQQRLRDAETVAADKRETLNSLIVTHAERTEPERQVQMLQDSIAFYHRQTTAINSQTTELESVVTDANERLDAATTALSQAQREVSDITPATPAPEVEVGRQFRAAITHRLDAATDLFTAVYVIRDTLTGPTPGVSVNGVPCTGYTTRAPRASALLAGLLVALSSVLDVPLRHPIRYKAGTLEPVVFDANQQPYEVCSAARAMATKANRLLYLDARQLVACSGSDLASNDNAVQAISHMAVSTLLNVGWMGADRDQEPEPEDRNTLDASPYMLAWDG